MSTITLFGLGAMGKALALKYIETGYTTMVWNRSPSKAQPLLEKGALLASTVAEALEAFDLIILCLLDAASVRETVSTATPSLRGKTLVNLTNGTPAQARELSTWSTAHGAAYIHGGIMAVPDMIGSPHAVLLYSSSGGADTFTRIEPHLAHLGTAKFLSADDAGAASLHDLAMLAGMYGLFSGFLHAVSLVKSQSQAGGLTASNFLQELLAPWLSAMTGYLGALAAQIDAGDYATQGSSLGMQVGGMGNIVAASEEAGVSAEFIRPILEGMRRAVEGGYADADVSAVIEFTKLEKGE
ncbi:NAD(P)-binding protein [Aspergillus pseudoustus]|uniref:NAD(P)-binding protein n=1 Tax=Aspergillus pseudoustus TaxID=1810923 RepID=A0ABR4ILK2_9EURO